MSHTTPTTVRAFSSSPTPAAKKTYQLKRLAKAKKLLKTVNATQSTDAFGIREFLDDVQEPNESEKILRDIEKKIASLQRRILDVEKDTPLASGSRAPASSLTFEVRTSDAFDAVGTKVDNATGPSKRPGRHERELARRRKQERFRDEKLNELGILLDDYRKQAAVLKAEAEKQAEMRKRREEVLAKKRALLQQLSAYEEEERRASLVRRTTKNEGQGLAEGFDLDDVLDDAMGRVKKMPMHPPREERGYKEREVKDVDVPRAKRLMRPAGTGAVSVLARKNEDDALVDPIMDKERDHGTTPTMGKRVDVAAVEDVIPPVANAGDPFPPASLQQKKPKDANKTIKKDIPRSPLSSPTSKDDLRLNIPPSGIIPIDADLIISFDAPVPHLQQQVLALRDRLKSSYPRIDNLPYDVWTSSNKRTLQTWLKILISRWNARFDDVHGTGQVDKGIVDDRVKEVLDSMVREHDLDNDAAERMAMRWHEAFERRWDMRGDAEGVLDWEEMEAGGMGFLSIETEESGIEVPVGGIGEEVDVEKKQTESAPVRSAGSGVTMPGVMGRRMYSTVDAKPDAKTDPEVQSQPVEPPPSLPHLTPSGSAHMVSVSAKEHTTRTAIAVGTVYFTNAVPLRLIRSNANKKGDVLGTSRIAGIMAAKKCPDLIPLCHPIALTHVSVELRPFGDVKHPDDIKERDWYPEMKVDKIGHGGVAIEAKVQCTGPTGVEMEALTAVMGAALSVVDMCKAVDRMQRVEGVRVVVKEGGKSGVWRERGWRSWQE
ncbi:molybdenum cofactor biosynthesis protein 1 B [Alternaria rosae]|uniref:molybdenum cofactor biosynthesis protein 1 B n=1 Tax=Alternaria rosae TaxID=1187941 RepID=UPI001E8E1A7F|nr:molybdenum cofactor biosynthesis protein 1 B [Alternaria rosae]KAH6857456.1 molybdenum cofactor biosynthesis protein 1 B [Alternaria rosae]